MSCRRRWESCKLFYPILSYPTLLSTPLRYIITMVWSNHEPHRTADIHQSTIERESLRGTVYGLESWVDGWHGEDVQRRWSKLNPRDRRMLQAELDVDCEALREGVRAWMRGWKDIDEGVRVREREREVRREARRGYTGAVVGCGDGVMLDT